MSYPLVESCLYDYIYVDGKVYKTSDEAIRWVFNPTDSVTYYETVRILDSKLLFIEEHLARLSTSVSKVQNFGVDLNFIQKEAINFLNSTFLSSAILKNANLRIVLTSDNLILHICEANIPSSEIKRHGIVTRILSWERQDPNVKVFRGDYKEKVKETFDSPTKYGVPYEILLSNNNDKLYEGSKSNLFVVVGDDVYSETDDKILIGITRKRVIESLDKCGLNLKYKTFTLEEIVKLKAALFVSSTPFDILPIYSINDVVIDSAQNINLRRISETYDKFVIDYIRKN